MFVLGNFLGAIAEVLNIVLTIYMWIVIISALISWVNPDPYNPIVRFLFSVTEPVFATVRRRAAFPVHGYRFFSPYCVADHHFLSAVPGQEPCTRSPSNLQ